MIDRHKRFPPALVLCGIALLLATPARADAASPWVDDLHSSLRLIAGNEKPGAENLRAGIEIKLQPGWHTYWRYPGDSGVPPRFQLCRFRQCRHREGALSRAAGHHRRSRRHHRLQTKCDLSAARRRATEGQAGHAAPESRLRGLRETLRARRGKRAADAVRHGQCEPRPCWRRRKRACRGTLQRPRPA